MNNSNGSSKTSTTGDGYWTNPIYTTNTTNSPYWQIGNPQPIYINPQQSSTTGVQTDVLREFSTEPLKNKFNIGDLVLVKTEDIGDIAFKKVSGIVVDLFLYESTPSTPMYLVFLNDRNQKRWVGECSLKILSKSKLKRKN